MSVHRVVNADGTVSFKARAKDLNRRSIQATFRTERDARRWDREQADKRDRGVQPRPHAGQLTYAAWAERFIAARKLTHRNASHTGLEQHVRLHHGPAFGDRRLSAITPSDVQEFINQMTTTHAPGTVRLSYKWLNAVLNGAVAARELGESPCGKHIVLPVNRVKRKDPLTVEQVEHAIATINPRYSALVLLAARTGMRQGECFGLRWKHVDVDAGTIGVNAQYVVPYDGTLTDLKTATSRRTLYVDHVVIDALLAHRERYGMGSCFDGVEGVECDDVVFSSARTGGPVMKKAWAQVWAPVHRRLGLERGEGMHQLRHFAGSVMMRSGVMSLIEIRDALGHSSLTELDRYCHTFADRRDSMRAAMTATFGDDTVRPLRAIG